MREGSCNFQMLHLVNKLPVGGKNSTFNQEGVLRYTEGNATSSSFPPLINSGTASEHTIGHGQTQISHAAEQPCGEFTELTQYLCRHTLILMSFIRFHDCTD